MIERSRMFEPLLAAYPEFKSQYDTFMAEWADDPEPPPSYLLLADLARECLTLLVNGQDAQIRNIFAVAEDWHLNGDAYVQQAATVGFLENIQNSNIHVDTEPDDFLRFCGPESRFWWEKVARFWSHGELLVDTRRSTGPDGQE